MIIFVRPPSNLHQGTIFKIILTTQISCKEEAYSLCLEKEGEKTECAYHILWVSETQAEPDETASWGDQL